MSLSLINVLRCVLNAWRLFHIRVLCGELSSCNWYFTATPNANQSNSSTTSFVITIYVFICLSKCQCLFILLHIELYYYTFNQCKILTLCSHSFYMRHQLSLMIQQIYLLSHHCQTSYHTKLFYQTVLFSYLY